MRIAPPISRKLFLSVFVLFVTASHAAQTADLVIGENAAPPVKFGAEEIRHALEKRGVKIATSYQSSADVRIYLGQRGDSNLRGVDLDVKVPDKPESYGLAVGARQTIVVESSDAPGAMYGAFDLAEQIGWASGDDFVGQIKPASKSPFLEIRDINMFLTTQDIDEPAGAFWSDEYWSGHFAMMARNRYNFLDIHGLCDAITVTFPNGFAHFVSLPDFPQVGVGPERAARNMARFRQVVRMAADRGIKVGYMNYEARAPIGPWKTRRFGVDERGEALTHTQEFLEGPRLEQYTREAVASFLKGLPELWMFGFRIGESGQPEDFYKKTYLEALKDAPASLKVYVRTWGRRTRRRCGNWPTPRTIIFTSSRNTTASSSVFPTRPGWVVGPNYFVIDASLSRFFWVREGQRLEVRVEAFNLGNNVNFNNPTSALNSSNFGKILGAGDPRILQLAMKYHF